ncbi:MAG: hypothetical protein MJE66_23920 [Proteobacteria bacterium]|nr:hypothetical protein [Pseudomonadota bacterium]
MDQKRPSVRIRLGVDTVALRRHGEGFAAEGPGFYVWDRDPKEVCRVVRELEWGLRAAACERVRVAPKLQAPRPDDAAENSPRDTP